MSYDLNSSVRVPASEKFKPSIKSLLSKLISDEILKPPDGLIDELIPLLTLLSDQFELKIHPL